MLGPAGGRGPAGGGRRGGGRRPVDGRGPVDGPGPVGGREPEVPCEHCAKTFQQRKLQAHLNYCRVSICTKRDGQERARRERQCGINRSRACRKMYYFTHKCYKE